MKITIQTSYRVTEIVHENVTNSYSREGLYVVVTPAKTFAYPIYTIIHIQEEDK